MQVVLTGASGGIGSAMLQQLLERPQVACVHALVRDPSRLQVRDSRLQVHACDLTDAGAIELAQRAVAAQSPSVDWIVHAAGALHTPSYQPEKSITQLDAAALMHQFALNAAAPALLAKAFWPQLRASGPRVFVALSARVGSIGDNRLGGWYSYRASKAALNQLMRTLAVELKRVNPQALCAVLHPGTVDTALSQPFQRSVPEGKLFSPAQAAQALLGVIDGLQTSDSGGFFAWDGSIIPW